MISFKKLSVVSGAASVLGGTLLPLALGVRDPESITYVFSLFMGAYGVYLILHPTPGDGKGGAMPTSRPMPVP